MKQIQLNILETKDAPELFELIRSNILRLARYFPLTVKSNGDIDATIQFLKELKEKSIKKETYAFGIYSGELLIGMMYIKNIDWRIPKCELGYFIDQASEGKGIMSTAIEKTLKHCFNELKMKKVYLRIGTENFGSKRVAVKNGFILEGTLRSEFKIETNEIVDVEYYGVLNPD